MMVTDTIGVDREHRQKGIQDIALQNTELCNIRVGTAGL
jgi:hypothetical protein